MSGPTPRTGVAARDGGSLAAERLRFLTAGTPAPRDVRTVILASWKRSRALKVQADKVLQPYTPDIDVDTPLNRRAQPVLQTLRDQLDGQPMSIILTDANGLVLSRESGDSELNRYLDGVLLAPGFQYSEASVGTNGIGTCLEVGGPTYVFGHEHYAEDLDRLACAGVPIRNPVSGRTVGALDLTCWSKDAGPLLLALAKTTAEQIRQSMLEDADTHQVQLIHEYLRMSHRLPGMVFAVDGDTVIMSEHLRKVLTPLDQAAMVTQAGAALVGGRRRSVDVDLPSGVRVRLHGHPVGTGSSGSVVHVKLTPTASRAGKPSRAAQSVPLPGLAGSTPIWLRACREVETASLADEWVMVRGEPGVGKLAIIQAAQLRRQPVRRLVVLDAALERTDAAWAKELSEALERPGHSLVIQHVDALVETRTRELTSALGRAKRLRADDPPWVAVTLGGGEGRSDLRALSRHFPRTIDVPALRLRTSDLTTLVTFFLARLSSGEPLTCSPEAMTTLARGTWHGNVQELFDVLREVVRTRRSGTIQLEDLPPGTRAVSRRRLSVIEAMERDAIVQALVDHGGDKSKAATSLGMSRATIYRKIHDYGLTDVQTG